MRILVAHGPGPRRTAVVAGLRAAGGLWVFRTVAILAATATANAAQRIRSPWPRALVVCRSSI